MRNHSEKQLFCEREGIKELNRLLTIKVKGNRGREDAWYKEIKKSYRDNKQQ